MTTHSYTSISLFQTCPRWYEAERILKVTRNTQTEQKVTGIDYHEAVERCILGHADPASQPPAVQLMHAFAASIPGEEKITEFPLSLDRDWNQVPLRVDRSVNWGKTHVYVKLDFVALQPSNRSGIYIDWKFGKSDRPKPEQCELGMLCVMSARQDIDRMMGALVFTDGTVAPAPHQKPMIVTRDEIPQRKAIWMAAINEIEQAIENRDFPATPSGLCHGWCPNKSCEHSRPMKAKR